MENNMCKSICPVCDHVISDFEEGINDPCEHVMLTYVDLVGDEFCFVHSSFVDIAKEMIDKATDIESEELVTVEECIEKYANENDGFEVIEMSTSGMACGPVFVTEYNLIKTK
jgi:hypothetical protein